MSCKSINPANDNIRTFMKINLLNNMANEIAAFGESQGSPHLSERIDLTCGAVPPGNYEQVVDQSAAHQFLSMYIHTAEYRFAFAVTETLKVNQALLTPIKNFCNDVGKANKPDKISTVEAAYETINAFILDGMPCDETKITTVVEPNNLIWEKKIETHEEFWNKAGGSVETYYLLQECFIQGLLEGSEFSFTNQNNTVFSLTSA